MLEASKEDGRYNCVFKIDGCCMFASHIDLRKDKQLLEIVILTCEEMTTHSHMKNKEESYSQVNEDVQSDDIQGISQKEDGKGIIEIKRMFGKEEIHSYEHRTKSFIRKTDEANTKQMENLMKNLVSYSFETNLLCVNAGYTEVRELFSVVIRERKRKDMIFQKLEKGNSHNLVMQRKEQLLNIAIVNYADIRQLLKTEAKGEQLLKVDIEDFVDVKQLLKIIDLEESQSKEGLKTNVTDNEASEDRAELLGEIPNEMIDLWHESSLLEKRKENQRISDHIVQPELNENEEIVMDEKYGKEDVRNVGTMRKQDKAFVFDELIDSDEYLYIGTRQCEVNLNQGADSEDHIKLMKGEIRRSQKDEMLLNLQYGSVEQERSSRDDSNRITIVPQRVIDEEEVEDDISEVDKYETMILKCAKFKILEE